MNKEDSFYMDTLEKTQPETFDFINHLPRRDFQRIKMNHIGPQARKNFPLLLTKSITSSRLSGVPIS